jgi:spore maturation protein CgeB
MKVLILDTYYSRFLEATYRQTPGLASRPYAAQLEHLLAQCFGTSDFYSRHLREFGVDAADIVVNCAPLQLRWAQEHGLGPFVHRAPRRGVLRSLIARLRGDGLPSAFRSAEAEQIALAQIRAIAPDVLYCQELTFLSPAALAEAKRHVRLLVGQIASPLPEQASLAPFDLILTSFPHFVPRFRALGIASEYFKIGFEPRVLERLGAATRHRAVTFVGGISPAHGKGTGLLEALARRVPLEVFGYGAETLEAGSELARRHRGEAWALDMYRVLCESRITINRHIDVAEDYANNMRLFEATGCGALLMTDAKRNLDDLFRVGVEVVAYRDVDEAVALVEQYLEDDEARERIARAGQQRTLQEHTYAQRMRELVPILEQALAARSAA